MRLLFCSLVLVLSGCASQVMEGMVGKDITEIQLQYGPPVNVLDLPDGRKAFQWRFDSQMVMPSTTNYSAYGSGNMVTGTAYTYGGGVISTPCFYTLFARPNNNKSYTVVGFQPPSLECE
jgi:hypothetical protein